MVYHGVGVGITIYHDGREIVRVSGTTGGSNPIGNGQVVVGRRTIAAGDRYASASVDEIKFYNRQLTQEEISNMYRKL